MGKKIKNAVRKVTKPIEKAVKKTASVGEDIVKGAVGAVTGKGQGETTIVNEAPAAVQAAVQAAPPPAQLIEPPKPEDASGEDDAQTESGLKKARAGGKKSLSVARSSGGGINI